MKIPQLALRDFFWLLLVAAIVSFGYARERSRDKRIELMAGSVDFMPTILYPTDATREGDICPLGTLEEGESVEVLLHDNSFEYTVRLKSRGEVVEKRFAVEARSCSIKNSATPSASP
jgi:hypothetical protein